MTPAFAAPVSIPAGQRSSQAGLADVSYIGASSGRFGYRRFRVGSGVPLILVTRFRGTIDHWDPALLEVLARERDVILVDYPGVNTSDGSTPATVRGLGDGIAEFIGALGLERADLLGWSLGGYVVQDLALNHPGLVRRLVVAASGPGAVPGTPAPPARIWEAARRPVNDDDDFLYMFFPDTPAGRQAGLASLRRLDTRLAASHADTKPGSVAAQAAALTGWGKGEDTSWERLAELRLPVLVGAGARDHLMHLFGAYSMAQRLPDAKIVFYTDSGHGFLFQHADDFGEEVLRFLS
jgi:pimeloyl-ACP methyl ester carboxylesterase